jgi:Transient receptor potential (TRP) ion channel
MIFIFYQWTLKDSWLSLLLSIIVFLAIVSLVSSPAFLTIRIARHSTPHALYSDTEHFALKSALYAQYRAPRYYYFLLPMAAYFGKAICISFADGNGEVQVILMVILEGVTVISHLALRPCSTKGGDAFSIFLASIRLLCTALTIAFVERLNLAPIPRVVIGLVIAAIFSVAVIITLINLVARSGIEQLWKHDSLHGSAGGSCNGSMLERGELGTSKSLDHIGRPINPTPERSIALDPRILQPYPISPTATATEQPSLSSCDSHTITIGSLLPRRWSFSPLNSPTNSLQSHEPSLHTPQLYPTAVS